MESNLTEGRVPTTTKKDLEAENAKLQRENDRLQKKATEWRERHDALNARLEKLRRTVNDGK